MKRTFLERQELRKQCADDIDRMLLCLWEAGFKATDDDAVRAWTEYSDDNCAGWLTLPDRVQPCGRFCSNHHRVPTLHLG